MGIFQMFRRMKKLNNSVVLTTHRIPKVLIVNVLEVFLYVWSVWVAEMSTGQDLDGTGPGL